MAASVSSRTTESQSTRTTVTHRVPTSPRTPLIGRSISGAFGSPGSYLREQEDVIVYELDPRYFSAGYAGEHRPRCIWQFGYAPNERARVGDYSYLTEPRRTTSKDHVLYQADLRDVDMTLVKAKFERVVRTVHLEQLQLDQKQAKKAALLVSPSTPTRILELAMGVLFDHYTQPPSITIFTRPAMSCVAAGVRDGLVIDIGWEESIVTAVAEYRTVFERRTIRGGKMLTEAYQKVLEQEETSATIDFTMVEEVRDRYAWVESTQVANTKSPGSQNKSITVPRSEGAPLEVPHKALSDAAQEVFINSQKIHNFDDDNEQTIPTLAYNVLRHLPGDLRSSCAARIIVDGSQSHIPGLRTTLLERVQDIIDRHGWEMINDFGSVAQKHSAAPALGSCRVNGNEEAAETDKPRRIAYLPARDKPHDDVKDLVTQKAEKELLKRRVPAFSGKIRGVESLGAWTGASMVLGLHVKGTCEVERDDFLKHGLRYSASLMI